jgi:GDP-L-fucose synthase
MKSRTLITGGTGMVGSAFRKTLPEGFFHSSREFDLREPTETKKMMEKYRPDAVIHLAAKVGGVKGNIDYVADYYSDNILINTNVLNASHLFGVKKVVSLLSTCIYPDKVKYPITEEQLHEGEPHFSNFGYAYSKRMIEVQSRAYRQQHGSNFICAVPNNLYGEHDNFDLDNSHVIPALIRKIWEAKISNKDEVVVWGDGTPVREFTYSEDISKVLIFLLNNYDGSSPINIGNTQEYSISDVVENICQILEYRGKIRWDTSKPPGQHKKPSDNTKLIEMGWDKNDFTPLDVGLKKTCDWFIMNYPNVRGCK